MKTTEIQVSFAALLDTFDPITGQPTDEDLTCLNLASLSVLVYHADAPSGCSPRAVESPLAAIRLRLRVTSESPLVCVTLAAGGPSRLNWEAWPRKVSLYILIIGILLHGSYDVGTATAFLTRYHEGVKQRELLKVAEACAVQHQK